MYKVNWDVTINTKNECIGPSIVVQDYEGVVLARQSATKNFLLELVVAKALVAFFAVELC